MNNDDLFAWAASLPQEHNCEWVQHPTDEERWAGTHKVVMRRRWWCPFLKTKKVTRLTGANVGYAHFKQCAICDERVNLPSGGAPNFVSPGYRSQMASAYKEHDRDTAWRSGYGNLFNPIAPLQGIVRGLELQRRELESIHASHREQLKAIEATLRPNGSSTSHTLQDACVFE